MKEWLEGSVKKLGLTMILYEDEGMVRRKCLESGINNDTLRDEGMVRKC